MKVAIVGGAPSSEMLAPFDDESWEVWVLGNRAQKYKRMSRVFEVHDNLQEHGDVTTYKNYILELSKKHQIIVGEKFFDDIEPINHNWVIFDYEAAEKLFGSLYFTSSGAYMMAYAILQGATEIGIYGIDHSINDHEYFWQRPCMEAWIGFAKGRGIKVTIPEVSHIGKSKYIEGRDWNGETEVGVFSEEGFSTLRDKHKVQHEAIQRQRQELALKAAAHDGAMQVYENLAKIARAVDAQVDVKSLLETTVLR